MPTTPRGCGTTRRAPGQEPQARRAALAASSSAGGGARAWRIASSDGKISRSCVSCGERPPKSREIASAHSPAWSLTSASSRSRRSTARRQPVKAAARAKASRWRANRASRSGGKERKPRRGVDDGFKRSFQSLVRIALRPFPRQPEAMVTTRRQRRPSRCAATCERLREMRGRGADGHAPPRLAEVKAWQAARLARTYADLSADPRYGQGDGVLPRRPVRRQGLQRPRRGDAAHLPGHGAHAARRRGGDGRPRDRGGRAFGGTRPAGRRLPRAGTDHARPATRKAYREAGTRAERERQIELIDEVGRRLDGLVVKPMFYTTLKLMRRPAKLAGLRGPADVPRARLRGLPPHGRGGRVPRDHRRGARRGSSTAFFPGTRARFRADGLLRRGPGPRVFAEKSVSSSSWTARSMEPRSALRRKPSVTVRCRSLSVRTSLPATPGRSKCRVLPVQLPASPNFFPRSAAISSAAWRAAFMPRWWTRFRSMSAM